MLKGLNPLLSPELLSTLRAMGHGMSLQLSMAIIRVWNMRGVSCGWTAIT